MASKGKGTRYLTRGLAAVGAGALALHGWRLGLTLMGTTTEYRVNRDRLPPGHSDDFRDYLSAIVDAQIYPDTGVSVLRNGEQIYAAELEAIRRAEKSINLEMYEFVAGEIAQEFVDAFTDRARAGVEVRIILDAIGSWGTHSSYFNRFRAAGGRFSWYHPVKAKTWPYLNQRTHRKLLMVDGEVGFIGGAGIADQWFKPNAQGQPWRDTMMRIHGCAVAGLNSVFAENWLETTGEILAGKEQFRFNRAESGVPAMVVTSTPHGGTTRARILYQALIESANKTIHITTPYFVPDRNARRALMRAARDRGVDVKVITAGPHSDHAMTRDVGRMFDQHLAKAGAEIYEYQPSMIHTKLMTVDGLWTVAGSTNFDHRSFDINDEVNIAISDGNVAREVDQLFSQDLQQSRLLTAARLKHTSLATRLVEEMSWVVRREQ